MRLQSSDSANIQLQFGHVTNILRTVGSQEMNSAEKTTPGLEFGNHLDVLA
jgi:hypothetical protein